MFAGELLTMLLELAPTEEDANLDTMSPMYRTWVSDWLELVLTGVGWVELHL